MVDQKNTVDSQGDLQPTAGIQPSRLEELLAENLALTREIHALTMKTKRYLYFAQVATVVKLVLIVGPLIAAALFLPPYLKQALSAYQELLGGGTGQTAVEGQGLIQEATKLLKNYQNYQEQ